MAKKLLTSYTFTPGAANAGTVVVSGTYALEQFLLITNVTDGVTIFQFNKPAKGGTVSTGGGNTTLTLEADTSSMSAGDRLQVFVDDGLNPQFTLTNASVEISNDVGNAVPVSAASLPLPSGAATAANQVITNTSLNNIDFDLGAQTDAVATSDTGTFSLLSFIKRGLQNWTSLLSRLPTLTTSGGRLQVDGSATTQPISDGGFLDAIKEDLNAADGSGPGLVLPSGIQPDPLNPIGPALQTTLRDPIQLDPSVAAVIGGVDPTGNVQRAKVGTDGGLQLTDGRQFVGIAQAVNGSPTGWIDTTGYQSIVVTFFGAPTATVAFQATNDQNVPVAGGNLGGWPLAGAAAPAITLANPGAGATWQFPANAKFFRVLVSAYTSGVVGAVVVLRSTPASFVPSSQTVTPVANSTVNLNLVGGSAALTANVPGLLAFGGSLQTGFQTSQFNVRYGQFTQSLASQTAAQSVASPITVGGLDGANASRPVLLDNLGAVAVTSAPSTPAQQSIHELLYQILATLRAIAHYEYDNGTRPLSDEPDNLIGEYLSQANGFTNLSN